MAVWVQELHEDSFQICLREAKIFDGPHKNIKIVRYFDFNLCLKTIFEYKNIMLLLLYGIKLYQIITHSRKITWNYYFLLQNWMAFTNLRVDNFTLTDSLVFANTNSPSPQDDFAFCQVRIESTIQSNKTNSVILVWASKKSILIACSTIISGRVGNSFICYLLQSNGLLFDILLFHFLKSY